MLREPLSKCQRDRAPQAILINGREEEEEPSFKRLGLEATEEEAVGVGRAGG